jgi:hypothetical protein
LMQKIRHLSLTVCRFVGTNLFHIPRACLLVIPE